MKATNSKILSIAALIAAVFALLCSAVNARNYARLIAPRSYRYDRPYHDAFNLVSEMLRAPVYYSSVITHQSDDRMRTERTTPNYSVSEENGVVQLEMEVPGIMAKDLEIEIEDNELLRIKGVRKSKSGTESAEESGFELTFRLNKGLDTSKLNVSLSTGILRVQLPHKEKVTRRIPITTETEDNDLAFNEFISNGDNTNASRESEVDGITVVESD